MSKDPVQAIIQICEQQLLMLQTGCDAPCKNEFTTLMRYIKAKAEKAAKQ